MDLDPNKVINTIAVIFGSALIGHGMESLSVAIGVFLIAFSLLPSD